jgi:hypothetical protein
MKSMEDLQWHSEPGLLYKAAEQGAISRNITVNECLEVVMAAMVSYKKSHRVHDREEFYSFLENEKKLKAESVFEEFHTQSAKHNNKTTTFSRRVACTSVESSGTESRKSFRFFNTTINGRRRVTAERSDKHNVTT